MLSIASIALKFWPFLALAALWLWMAGKQQLAVHNARKAERQRQELICDQLRRDDAGKITRSSRSRIKRARKAKVKRLTPDELRLQCAADPNCREDGE